MLTDTQSFTYAMQTVGFFVVRGLIDTALTDILRLEIDAALHHDQQGYQDYRAEHRFYDIVHCLIARPERDAATTLFQAPELLRYIDVILGETCIMHSFNAVALNPGQDNNAVKIHRDTPRFYDNSYPLSIQALVCVDPFTPTTGATRLLPASHHVASKPSDDFFHEHAYEFTGEPGDVIFFDSLIWHCAGHNTSQAPRRGITNVYTRSFMKQQIDLVACLEPEYIASLTPRGQVLAGMHVIPPKNLEEFFYPVEQRTYKPHQG